MDDRKTIPAVVPDDLHDGVRVVAMSDVGCVREENQDFMGWFPAEGAQLLVVADGMGGHSGGFEASRIAVDRIRETFVEQGADGEPAEVLAEAVRQANAGVREVAASNALMRGMGTTVVVALVRDGQAWLAHVGDSRAYLVRDGRATQLTLDHSRVNRMVAAGLLTPEAAIDHPMGHILERSVGADDHVEAEVSKPLTLLRGDRLMLCSDGLWGLVRGPEIAELFTGAPLRESVEAAITRALERGADDNTTVGALEVVEGEEPIVDAVGADETRRMPAATSEVPGIDDPPPGDRAAATGLGFILAVVSLVAIAAVLVLAGLRLMNSDEPAPGTDGVEATSPAARPTPTPAPEPTRDTSPDKAKQEHLEPATPPELETTPSPEATPEAEAEPGTDADKLKQGALGDEGGGDPTPAGEEGESPR